MTKPFDPSKPVMTRDGRPARILCTDLENPGYPIAAAIRGADGEETVQQYTADGSLYFSEANNWDLINTKEKVTGFVNIYLSPNGNFELGKRLYTMREIADGNAREERVACVEITFEVP